MVRRRLCFERPKARLCSDGDSKDVKRMQVHALSASSHIKPEVRDGSCVYIILAGVTNEGCRLQVPGGCTSYIHLPAAL